MQFTTETFGLMVEWFLGQDPLPWLVILLLVRGEVRTAQALRALKIMDVMHDGYHSSSKGSLM